LEDIFTGVTGAVNFSNDLLIINQPEPGVASTSIRSEIKCNATIFLDIQRIDQNVTLLIKLNDNIV